MLVNEVKNKISNVTNLPNKTNFTAVENKIPDFRNLVSKNDYNSEITKIENLFLSVVYISYQDYY